MNSSTLRRCTDTWPSSVICQFESSKRARSGPVCNWLWRVHWRIWYQRYHVQPQILDVSTPKKKKRDTCNHTSVIYYTFYNTMTTILGLKVEFVKDWFLQLDHKCTGIFDYSLVSNLNTLVSNESNNLNESRNESINLGSSDLKILGESEVSIAC